MSVLWENVLQALQEINSYGGNFFSFHISRAIIEQIDDGAASGDVSLARARERLLGILRRAKWPDDADAFNAFFEHYHEALFYLLARERGVRLEHIPESKAPTPDFETRPDATERFEVKTIDISGGKFAHKKILQQSLAGSLASHEAARATGIGFHELEVSPHGDAEDSKEAVEQVRQKLAQNVKEAQFDDKPTFLVAVMARTALRTGPDELKREYDDKQLGGRVSGHLWAIAANNLGQHFFDFDRDWQRHDFGPLNQEGVLKDFPFIRGILFLSTEWSELDSADRGHSDTLGRAYRLHGIWNSAYSGSAGVGNPYKSEFAKLCDSYVQTKDWS